MPPPCSSTLAWGATSTPSSAPTCPGGRRRCSLTRKSPRRATNWTPPVSASIASCCPTHTGITPRAWSTSRSTGLGTLRGDHLQPHRHPAGRLPQPIPPWRALATLQLRSAAVHGLRRKPRPVWRRPPGAGPLPGHTPGSVGLFVTLDSGRRLFFSGDTSWRLEGVEGPRQKFFAGRALVDRDPARTLAQLAKIRLLLRSDPRLSVIPAHDARVQAALGYFPHWLE